MALHLAGIAGLTALLVGYRLLPFLPGDHDSFSVALAAVAGIASFASVLFVPIGASWLIVAARRPHTGYYFAIATGVVAMVIGSLILLMAFLNGLATGAAVLALELFAARSIVMAIRSTRAAGRPLHPAPLYLVAVPVLAIALQLWLVPLVAERSRQRGIANSAQLIAEIEAFRSARGHYPVSLLALHQDYEPAVIGIRGYSYAPHGEGFNLYFENPPSELGAREIVMFNARGEHFFTSHDSDLLRWTPEQVLSRRTYVERRDSPAANWKSFLFD
jgi:hypothetical protein